MKKPTAAEVKRKAALKADALRHRLSRAAAAAEKAEAVANEIRDHYACAIREAAELALTISALQDEADAENIERDERNLLQQQSDEARQQEQEQALAELREAQEIKMDLFAARFKEPAKRSFWQRWSDWWSAPPD